MRELFNSGWEFAKLHIENQEENGKPKIYSPKDFLEKFPGDSCFESVTVPHDWMIFDTQNLYENSVGFYKKDFDLTIAKNERFFIRFGAVYMNWAIWVNGKFAGDWKYGYSTVEFEITPFVQNGKNTIQLISVYQNPNTRWYSGAGIFRDVEFIKTNAARIASDGIYFVSRPSEKNNFEGNWNVSIQTEISGPAEGITVNHKLIFADGSILNLENGSEKISNEKILQPKMGECFDVDEKITVSKFTATVKSPKLWDNENPNVYILKTSLKKDGELIDSLETQVGFKDVVFDNNKGMFVNGKHIKINGVCEHHDLGLLGAAFDLVAVRRKFLRLKEMGVNSIRTAHNPQDSEYLNLADRMGIFINCEFYDMWEKPKTTYDYGNYFVEYHTQDTAAQVRRNRNHPSLIMWSVGNEIYDTHSGNGFEITKDLREICKKFDPEKNGAVTIGSNYMEWEGAQNCANEIDLVGYNYLERLYPNHHKKNPGWKIYGSETSSTVQSRNIYHFPLSNRMLTFGDNQCSCLGNCTTSWGARSTDFVLTTERDTDYSLGQYIWTGWDYIGEPTPYFTKNSYFGQIDLAGFPKDTFYMYKSMWNKKASPFVHLLPYWDFNVGQKIDVRVYSNCKNLELFLNGKSLGKKTIDLEKGQELAAAWTDVIYEKGNLVAVAYDDNGKEICREEKKSFGDAKTIVSKVEKESTGGLYFIDLATIDADKNPVENSRSRMEITVDGNAVLLGADNGDSTDYEQFRSSDGKKISRKLFGNRLLAMVRGKNENSDFKITVASNGLESSVLVFKNGKFDETESASLSGKILDVENKEIPIRKIDLICTDSRDLGLSNKTAKVQAIIHPENATDKNIKWTPMMLEGVPSDCATVEFEKTPDGEIATVTASSDGEFRLSCTAANKSPYTEIISELEFSVAGIGRATRNPFTLIECCKCSTSLEPINLSFLGGLTTQTYRTWFSFDKVDFGRNGADTFSTPIFSFDNELDFEIWDGNPDDGTGTKLMDCHYSAKSIYNTYQSNSYVLPRRLFGVHTISFVFKSFLSLQGFVFEKSDKAFAKLNAMDCNSVVGDTFKKESDAITGIGNNVVLEFLNMDFGKKSASSISICGFSHVDNTIHVKFTDADGKNLVQILDFEKTDGYETKTFNLQGLEGATKVSFIFLPGSNFDFKEFKFN